MERYWKFEVKEKYVLPRNVRYFPKSPSFISNYPAGIDFIVGVCYLAKEPTKFINPDYGYKLAINAFYYLFEKSKWNGIGNADLFLFWLYEKTGVEISWPEPFENHPNFIMWRSVQLFPWRELIRRHVSIKNYVADIDMIIAKNSK